MKPFLAILLSIFTLSVKAQTSAAALTDTTVYTKNEVSVKPQFVGGTDRLGSFLAHTVRYPAVARERNTQGRVQISFIVEKDGKLTNFAVTKSVSKELDEESMRVMKLMPAWKPARNNDQLVRCLVELPVTYTLNNR